MKKQRFMGGGGGSLKPRKNQQQVDRGPPSFQRFMSMQAMDHAGRKEPDAVQRIFPIENDVTRSRSSKPFQSRPLMGAKRPLMGAKLRPPQRTFEQQENISPGRKPNTRPLVVAPNRMDKGERPRFDSPPLLDETRLGFQPPLLDENPRLGFQQQRVTPGPQPFMSPPPPKKSRMRSRQFGAKPNHGFRPSPPLNSVNPIDGGRPFIELHQNLGPGPSGIRSRDEFGVLVQQSATPQSHRGGASPGFDELKRLPPPPASAAAERSRSQQSANRPSSTRLQQPRIQQSANQLQLLPNQQSANGPSRLQQLPKPPQQALQRPSSSRFRQFGDREAVLTGVEELKHEPLKPLRPRHQHPTAQPIFQLFAQQPILDLATNSLDNDVVNLISSSSPAPPVSFKLGRLKAGGKGPFRKNHGPRPVPTPIRVSSPRPRVFDRTPSSLTDINSNVVSSNVFGRKSTANFLVQGPNYSISWGR